MKFCSKFKKIHSINFTLFSAHSLAKSSLMNLSVISFISMDFLEWGGGGCFSKQEHYKYPISTKKIGKKTGQKQRFYNFLTEKLRFHVERSLKNFYILAPKTPSENVGFFGHKNPQGGPLILSFEWVESWREREREREDVRHRPVLNPPLIIRSN